MFDTHCHLTFREFAGRTAQILNDARHVGVRGAITISTTSTDCLHARDLAAAHPNLWCSAGIHPLHSDEPLDWANVQQAAAHPKCVAWGELGLDHHYDRPPRNIQHKILAEQLAFIQSQVSGVRSQVSGKDNPPAVTPQPPHNKNPQISDTRHLTPDTSFPHRPIIVHCRDAFDDLLAIFRSTSFDPTRFVFHCFTGTADEARKVLDFGAFISFTGIVTFANAREVAEAARLVPADRIMVETDSPFLTPEPLRKLRPNEPQYVVHIANKLAQLRGVDPVEFEQQLDSNARRFFGINFA